MDGTTDSELMARVATGDEAAYATLYDRHGRAAYGVALRVLRDPHLAEDAVQDAFLAVWRSAGAFDPSRSAAATWIHTLVHRRAVDVVRREQRRRSDALPELHDLVGTEAGPEESALEREQRERALGALAELPDAQRVPLELAYYGGLTQTEIAARLDLPLGTIKSRTFAGLTRLGVLLGGREAVRA